MPIFLKRYGLVLSMQETDVSSLFNLERSVFIPFQWHDETMFQYFSLFINYFFPTQKNKGPSPRRRLLPRPV
jgi:hypothetical protein